MPADSKANGASTDREIAAAKITDYRSNCTLKNKDGFRFIFTRRWTGLRNMGVDGYLGESAIPDLPLVRFYTWDRPTISYGCNQNVERRLDLEACGRTGVPVVKRPTGGRELLHGHDLCYTVLMPLGERMSAVDARKVFIWINGALADALRGAGVEVNWTAPGARTRANQGPCFAQIDQGELAVGNKKLVASAQRLYDRCLIQQGSIPRHPASIDLVDYLKSPDNIGLRNKMRESTAYLDDFLGEAIDDDGLAALFRPAFERAFESTALSADRLFSDLPWNTIETYLYH